MKQYTKRKKVVSAHRPGLRGNSLLTM